MSYLAITYVNSYSPTKNALRKHKILKELRNNINVLITKPYKGNGVTAVHRIYYFLYVCTRSWMIRQSFWSYDLILLYVEKTKLKILLSLKNKEFYTKDVYGNIYLCGFKSDRINGNPKTHKRKSKTDMWMFRL